MKHPHQAWLGAIFTAAMAISAFAQDPANPWEKAIAQFESKDAASMPEPGGIVFVGSSSIRFWKTDEAFPDLKIVNRGFGGSQVADSAHFADRIVTKYKPRLVVFYAGDNDIAAGKTPDQVFDDYKTFVKAVRDKLPATRVAYISIKPSPARWTLVEKSRKANDLIKAHCESGEGLEFVDMDAPMIGGDGLPRKELFIADNLHLNETGYALWNKIIRPILDEDAAAP